MKNTIGYYKGLAKRAAERIAYGYYAGCDHFDENLTLANDVGVGSILYDPSAGLGTQAPCGSLLVQVNLDGTSSLWQKSGVDNTDWNEVAISGALNHSSLLNLLSDDHTQYLNTARHDTTVRHGSSVVDHGSIGGLSDNDHPQYPLLSSLTEIGDLWYASVSGVVSALHHSASAGNLLRSGGHGAALGWSTISETSGALSGVTTLSMSDQLTSTLTDGTPPFVIASATKVNNLHVARASLADGIPIAVASGVDTITATFSPVITLSNMVMCMIVAAGANTSTAPTFNPNSLGALTIYKKGGAALVAGDIPGALAVCILEYNSANTRWVLLNPAVPCYQ